MLDSKNKQEDTGHITRETGCKIYKMPLKCYIHEARMKDQRMQKKLQQLQRKRQEEDQVKYGEIRLKRTKYNGNKKQASNGWRASGMEESCIGNEDQ